MRIVWFVLALAACGGDKTDDATVGTDITDDTSDTDTTPDTDDTDDTDPPTGVVVPDVTGDPATVPLTGTCDQETAYGEFVVEAVDLFSIVDGQMRNAVVPIEILEEMATDGDCRLMRRNIPNCNPACGAGETCDWDGSCVPFPAGQDIGIVTFGGLQQDLVIEPVVPGFSYFALSLPNPVYLPGDLIELRTFGSQYGDDIELHGVGVDLMDLGGADQWVLVDGEDLEITWAAAAGRAEVHMQLNIDQHGQTPVQLFCEFEDDGTGTVPDSLIDQLINFGVSGFPNATLSRRTVDSTPMGDGCMQLRVSSPVTPDVRVDGFIPCLSDMDCPNGQTCDPISFICL